MKQNIRAVVENILAGNEGARIPGANAAKWRERCRSADGLLFTESEINALNELAREGGVQELKRPLMPYSPD